MTSHWFANTCFDAESLAFTLSAILSLWLDLKAERYMFGGVGVTGTAAGGGDDGMSVATTVHCSY